MSNKIKQEKTECSMALEKFYTFADANHELLEVTGRNLCDYLDNFISADPQSTQTRHDYELRLAKENQMLIENGFSGKILAWAVLHDRLRELGCLSGPGWGRLNSSLVTFLLGLGGLDPLRLLNDSLFHRLFCEIKYRFSLLNIRIISPVLSSLTIC